MHDLVVRGGLVVDGTGDVPRRADVAIDGGLVTEVGRVEASGVEELDAAGKVVTPGFVDIHTHYDGQVTWDPTLSPTSWHGVTTLVLGNCGCRGHPRHRAPRGGPLGVGDVPRVPRCCRFVASGSRRGGAGASRRHPGLRDGRAGCVRRDDADTGARPGRLVRSA